MLSFKHATHLVGHILASAVKEELPNAEVLQSKDLEGRFWVDIHTSEKIDEYHLSRFRFLMDILLKEVRLFSHKSLSMEEIAELFPSQKLKMEEAAKMQLRFGTLIPAYQLDSHIDFCSCEVKDIVNLREIETQGICELSFDASERNYISSDFTITRVSGHYFSNRHDVITAKC
jgi:threonyl-tRNA synthetase